MQRQLFFFKAEVALFLLLTMKMTANSYPRDRVRGITSRRFCDGHDVSTEGLHLHKAPSNCTDRPVLTLVEKADIAYCISNAKKIPKSCVCDGKFDCKDLSDEYLCMLENDEHTDAGHDIIKSFLRRANDSKSLNSQRVMILRNLRQHESPALKYPIRKTSASENALDFLKRTCIPGLNDNVKTSDKQMISPCDVCESKQVLCSEIQSNHSTKCVNKSQICDGIKHCPNNADEEYCHLNREDKKRIRHAKNNMTRPRFNQSQIVLTCESLRTTLNLFIDRMKTMHEYAKTRSTMPRFVNNGKMRQALLLPSIPRSLYSSKSIQRLQYESSNKSLDLKQICDHKFDCVGGLDEMICPRRFYCQSGNPLFVNSSVMSDGVNDCDDGSDEWAKRKGKWSIASNEKMVKDWYVLATMWIVGICATFGNSVVICKTFTAILKLNGAHPWPKLRFLALSFLKKTRIGCNKPGSNVKRDTSSKWRQGIVSRGWKKSIRIWDSVFILNLATADFLMGIYLVVLGSVSLSQRQNYWEFDKTWRTSLLCQSLGVLAVLSSQTSVFTLVGLTTLRLSTVIKPFGVLILSRMKLLALICCGIWIVSFLMAIFPILPVVTYSYASEAWIPLPHVRPNVINLTVANDLLQKTMTFSNNVTSTTFPNGGRLSWDELISITSNLIPAYSDWKLFGYYSAHSVCLPKLFVSIGETAWEHTAVLLSVNFVAFIYICIAYIIIYRLSIKSRSMVRNASEMSITRDYSSASVKELPGHHKPWHKESLLNQRDATFIRKKAASAKNDCCTSDNKKRKGKHNSYSTRRVRNMNKMQFRIALLVATDFLCWIPICIMGFLHLFGVSISNTAYTVSAIGLLPVNSALNPILYSNCLLTIPKSFCIRKKGVLKSRQ